MRVAVYSGSFDPVHAGHVALARYVASLRDIDEVWLLVTPHNPLKPQATAASFSDRMAMTGLAVADMPAVRVLDFESHLPPPHFTYSTLCALREAYPDNSFSLLIGSDNWLIFSSWRNHAEIVREFGLLIYPRPGYALNPEELPAGIRYLENAPMSEAASTAIRRQLADATRPGMFLQPDVYSYINSHRLYGRNQDKP